MSFSDEFSARVISPIANGTWELLDRRPQESATGWDSMRDSILLRHDASGTDGLAALNAFAALARGQQITGKNMWIQTRVPETLASGLFKVEITSQGLLSTRGYKVSYDVAAAVQSKENVTISGTTYPKVTAREGGVTATLEYVTVSSVPPTDVGFITKDVGRAKTPPSGWAPAVPTGIWAAISEPTYQYPNGWVFEAAVCENLPGLNAVWLVKEKYTYVRDYVP